VNRVISVIVGVIALWFGLIAAPGLTLTSSAVPAQGYADEARHCTPVCTDTRTERGPPTSHVSSTTCDGVDRRSRGASVRKDGATTSATYDSTGLLHVAQATTTTRGRVEVTDGHLLRFSGGVLPQTLRVCSRLRIPSSPMLRMRLRRPFRGGWSGSIAW
jgi:hypothetical protein